MCRAVTVLAIALCATSTLAIAPASDAKQRRAEIVAKADSLFKQQYAPRADMRPRMFDKGRESQPADTVTYWFNTNYVVRLVFASEGSLARIEFLPEAQLYGDSWTRVPDTVELGPEELPRIIAIASQLRPIGDPASSDERPDFCSWTGSVGYCRNSYQSAEVSSVRDNRVQPGQTSLMQVTIAYKQSVVGAVSEIKAVSENEQRLRVGPTWYGVYKDSAQALLDATAVGSIVRLTSIGCAGNELTCHAFLASATPPEH